MDAEADPYIKDHLGKTALDLAEKNIFRSKNVEFIKIMIREEIKKRRPLIKNKIIESVNLFPGFANIVTEYLYPTDTEEIFYV